MDWQATVGATPGQFLFFMGIVTAIIGLIILFLACDRFINQFCAVWNWDYYWIVYVIFGIGFLMIIIGWLLAKEEKVDEPTSSNSSP